jgi:hypothetical protein
MPMVIESIGQPLDSPIDVNGQVISTQIPLQINSYCAFDANDWRSARR